jgi:type IV pilus assembly protein PilC
MIIKLTEKKKIYILHSVSPLEIALAMRHLSIMLKTGLAIEDALKVLSEQTADEDVQEAFKDALKDVRSGLTLSESLAKHKKIFSDIIISIISVGEQGATLEKNLAFLADYLKKNYELQRKVKGSMLYPLVVMSLTMVEMLGVIFFILPKLESLFSSFKNTSGYTLFILAAAAFIRNNGGFILIAIIVFIMILRRWLATKVGKRFRDRMALSIPIFKKLNTNNILTTFSRTLGILLESGIPIQPAMKITGDTISNGIYANIVRQIADNLKSGKNLAQSLNQYKKYFPLTYVKMIEVGESSGSLEQNLDYLYEFYAEEVEEMSNNLTTLLEPIMLIFVGLMIGALALMIIGPIYQLSSTIRAK